MGGPKLDLEQCITQILTPIVTVVEPTVYPDKSGRRQPHELHEASSSGVIMETPSKIASVIVGTSIH